MEVSMGSIRLGARALLAIFAGVLLAAAAALPALADAATPGGANTGFGQSGMVTLPAGTRLFAAASQSNGDVVAVGESGANKAADVLLVRFTPSGALDPSFGNHGIVEGPAVPGQGGSLARAVAIQPDGKIVIVGKAADATGSSEAHDGILIERYDANGALDTSFGSRGIVNVLPSAFADGYAVALQPNGDILAGGSAEIAAVPYPTVVRLTPSGGGDSSFTSNAGAGVDVLDIGAYGSVDALALQPNGAIVLGGNAAAPGNNQETDSLIARLTSAGHVDTSFAGTGVINRQYAPLGAYSSVNALAVESDGKILAAGSATAANDTDDAFAVRLTSSGSQDSSFGSGGVAYLQSAENTFSTPPAGASALALAANGDAILAGQFANGVLTYGTLWALNPSGHLDTGFGHNGAAVLAGPSNENAEFLGLAQAPSGDLVAVGDLGGGSQPLSGLAAGYFGYGPVTPPVSAFNLKVTHVPGREKIATARRGGIRFTATCNKPCRLKATLSVNAATARRLGLGAHKVERCRKVHGRRRCTPVKRCRKVHGRRRCTAVVVYRPLTLASAGATLGGAGSHGFTLRFSRAASNAIGRQKSLAMTLTVFGNSTVNTASERFTKTITLFR
jgi:uncharacterized delta-60 repeat protein